MNAKATQEARSLIAEVREMHNREHAATFETCPLGVCRYTYGMECELDDIDTMRTHFIAEVRDGRRRGLKLADSNIFVPPAGENRVTHRHAPKDALPVPYIDVRSGSDD